MKEKLIRYSGIFTLLIFVLMILITTAFLPPFSATVEASSIENEDIYKGIVIGVLLYLLATSTQDREDKAVEAREPVEDIIDYKQEDIDLLARIIYAEARGEPYNGQVAVGAVILNRVEHPDFPDTIDGVIYQDGQFTSVTNGQFNLTPGIDAYNAAQDAINGIDPSNDALYFYNPKKARTLWWLETREKTAVIGEHVFAR